MCCKLALRFTGGLVAVLPLLCGTLLRADEPSLQLTVPVQRDGSRQLVTIDLDGNILERIETEPAPALEPDWSPDGRHLAFLAIVNGRGQIFLKDFGTGRSRRLSALDTDEQLATWSPDGKRLLFKSFRDGSYEVCSMDADGGDVLNLSSNPGYDADAVWSPDGQRVAFASARDNRSFRVFVMNADGSGQRPLIQDDLYGWLYPEFSPDGQRIAFGYPGPDGSVQLSFAWFDSGTWWKVTTDKAVNSFARWSPDGRYVAYVRVPLPVDMSAWTSELCLYDVERDTHRKLDVGTLPNQGGRPAWKPLPRPPQGAQPPRGSEPQRGAAGAPGG
jgi:TolB protein